MVNGDSLIVHLSDSQATTLAVVLHRRIGLAIGVPAAGNGNGCLCFRTFHRLPFRVLFNLDGDLRTPGIIEQIAVGRLDFSYGIGAFTEFHSAGQLVSAGAYTITGDLDHCTGDVVKGRRTGGCRSKSNEPGIIISCIESLRVCLPERDRDGRSIAILRTGLWFFFRNKAHDAHTKIVDDIGIILDAGLGAGPLGKPQIVLFEIERKRQLLVGCVTQSTQQQSVDISIKKSRLGGGHGILLPIKGKVQDRLYKQLVVTVNKSVISHASYITDPTNDRLISEVILDSLDIRRTACADNGWDGHGWSFPTVCTDLPTKRRPIAVVELVGFSVVSVALIASTPICGIICR